MKLQPACLVLCLSVFSLGTTYVIKENGVEVGRWTEEDGRDKVEVIENETKSSRPAVVHQADPSTPTGKPADPPAPDKPEDQEAIRAYVKTVSSLDQLEPGIEKIEGLIRDIQEAQKGYKNNRLYPAMQEAHVINLEQAKNDLHPFLMSFDQSRRTRVMLMESTPPPALSSVHRDILHGLKDLSEALEALKAGSYEEGAQKLANYRKMREQSKAALEKASHPEANGGSAQETPETIPDIPGAEDVKADPVQEYQKMLSSLDRLEPKLRKLEQLVNEVKNHQESTQVYFENGEYRHLDSEELRKAQSELKDFLSTWDEARQVRVKWMDTFPPPRLAEVHKKILVGLRHLAKALENFRDGSIKEGEEKLRLYWEMYERSGIWIKYARG